MRSRLLFVAAFLCFAACHGGGSNQIDAGHGSGDAAIDAAPPIDGQGVTETTCEVLPPLSTGTCSVTGAGTIKLLKGTVLTPTTVYHGGQVAIDATGQITCAGCNCAVGGETVITCPDAAISPGLINTHDHITFTQNNPYTATTERYEDRQQWRKGLDSHAKIPASGGASAAQILWGELRFLLGGATSIVGSGGQAGLLRNLDQAAGQEGLGKPAVDFDTFPLDDSSGTRRTADCNYGGAPTTAASLAAIAAYEPHTSEGIDATAHNEFLCESSTTYDSAAPGVSDNLVLPKTAIIHGVGLTANDYGAMATAGTGLIWSPRSNLTLYGDTARVSTAARMGVNIALGTDWMPTGSMNLLRELQCADSFNTTYMNHYFSDEQLWAMVTANAAAVTKMDDKIGLLAAGHVADITIFRGHGTPSFRSVITAKPDDVALVMRGGTVLYGDSDLVDALATTCDAIPGDVCGSPKKVCLSADIHMTLAQLTSAAGTIYPAFQCDVPMNEPSCTPTRPAAVAGSTVYTGVPSGSDSDGDGIADADDNCPHVFNPVRPMDGGKQADADGDGAGDSCDPCPLNANTSTCSAADPNDRDGDGVPNAMDNCPDTANADQLDSDHDGKGDVCDACPMDANPGAAGCPSTIYQIKQNHWPLTTAVVVTNALVTGKATNGFFIQVKAGDPGYVDENNSGVFVFTGATAFLATAVVNERVTVEGTVDNFAGEIELDNLTAVTATTTTAEAPPAPISVAYTDVVTGGPRAAALEGVIVTVPAGAATAVNATAGEFTLTAGPSSIIVDDLLLTFTNPAIGQTYTSVTGVLALRSAASKLEPRATSDLALGAPALSSLSPALSYLRAGAVLQHTFPVGSELTVTLTGPAQGDTVVTVASSDPSVTVANGGMVTVLNGTTSTQVQLSATTQKLDVVLTATLGTGAPQTAHVRVLGATEAPTTVTLSPATATVAPHGSAQLVVTLDLPPSAPTVVNLSAAPAGNGTLPATVTVGANQLSTSFTYTDVAATGDTVVTATLGASTSTATISVNTGANHLVINEIDYDQVNADTAEFIEIFNPSGSAVSLAGKVIMLVNGSDNTVYTTIDLSPATSIPSHGYLVIAGDTVTVVTSATVAKLLPAGWKAQDNIQNGAPDGIALVDTSGTTPAVIDALSYEGAITAAQLTGFASPVSLVEGTVLPTSVADSNTAVGSLCRSPDGQDTDVASADWKFCSTLTPGAANGN